MRHRGRGVKVVRVLIFLTPETHNFLVMCHIMSFQLLKILFWLRITDEGSVPEMRKWSILLIKSDLKWCIHLSRSLFLYSTCIIKIKTINWYRLIYTLALQQGPSKAISRFCKYVVIRLMVKRKRKLVWLRQFYDKSRYTHRKLKNQSQNTKTPPNKTTAERLRTDPNLPTYRKSCVIKTQIQTFVNINPPYKDRGQTANKGREVTQIITQTS